jgi:hypothetical protein
MCVVLTELYKMSMTEAKNAEDKESREHIQVQDGWKNKLQNFLARTHVRVFVCLCVWVCVWAIIPNITPKSS